MTRTKFFLILLTLWLKFQLNFAGRTCAYFPNYPSLTTISYANCSYESKCYTSYAKNASQACVEVASEMWWLCFIVILAVALLVIGIVIICCLVKKQKEADQQSLFTKQNYIQQQDDAMVIQPKELEEVDELPKFSVDLKLTEEKDDQFDINQAPNYFSLFEKQPTTISMHDINDIVTKPTLPATYVIDTALSKKEKSDEVFKNEVVATRNPRIGALSPINTSLSLN